MTNDRCESFEKITSMTHTSVLLNESIGSLALNKGMTVLDATFGAGGHSCRIAELVGSTGRLISFDADKAVFTKGLTEKLEQLTTFTPVNQNFRNIDEALVELGVTSINGALFDLGLSSTQLESSGRGFSFKRDEPLWMTFKEVPEEGDVTAESILNGWSEESITVILKGFGEERYARSIAKGIIKARGAGPLSRTSQLVEVIHDNTPTRYHFGRTHFATRTFQALRMAVNDELGAITSGITGAFEALSSGSRIAVISFHSIEDRQVKQLFRSIVDADRAKAITKKPMVPTDEEVEENPRSRSAKLRVIEKL